MDLALVEAVATAVVKYCSGDSGSGGKQNPKLAFAAAAASAVVFFLRLTWSNGSTGAREQQLEIAASQCWLDQRLTSSFV